jgi:hypothetical protein
LGDCEQELWLLLRSELQGEILREGGLDYLLQFLKLLVQLGLIYFFYLKREPKLFQRCLSELRGIDIPKPYAVHLVEDH